MPADAAAGNQVAPPAGGAPANRGNAQASWIENKKLLIPLAGLLGVALACVGTAYYHGDIMAGLWGWLHTQVTCLWAFFTLPVSLDILDLNFLLTQGIMVVVLTVVTTLLLFTRKKWESVIAGFLFNRPFPAAVFNHFILQCLEPNLLVNINIIISSIVFELLLAAPAHAPAAWQGFLANVFYSSTVMMFHGTEMGLIARGGLYVRMAAHAVFCFGLGVFRVHAILGGDGASFTDVLRLSLFSFPVPVMLDGALAVLPVIALARLINARFSGDTLKPIALRIAAQYAANALFTLWGVRVAFWLAAYMQPRVGDLTVLQPLPEVVLQLIVMGCFVFLGSFYAHALYTVVVTSPLFKIGWGTPKNVLLQAAGSSETFNVQSLLSAFGQHLSVAQPSNMAGVMARAAERPVGALVDGFIMAASGFMMWRSLPTKVVEVGMSFKLPADNTTSGRKLVLGKVAVEVQAIVKNASSNPILDAVKDPELLAMLTTDNEIVVQPNSRDDVTVSLRLKLFGKTLKMLAASRESIEGFRVVAYVDRGEFLPRFPIPLVTVQDGKFTQNQFLSTGSAGNQGERVVWLQNTSANLLNEFRRNSIVQALNGFEDSEMATLQMHKDAFIARMEEAQTRMNSRRNQGDSSRSMFDILTEAAYALCSMYKEGERLDLVNPEFSAMMNNCSATLVAVFYSEFVSNMLGRSGGDQKVQDMLYLGVTMIALQYGMSWSMGNPTPAPKLPQSTISVADQMRRRIAESRRLEQEEAAAATGAGSGSGAGRPTQDSREVEALKKKMADLENLVISFQKAKQNVPTGNAVQVVPTQAAGGTFDASTLTPLGQQKLKELQRLARMAKVGVPASKVQQELSTKWPGGTGWELAEQELAQYRSVCKTENAGAVLTAAIGRLLANDHAAPGTAEVGAPSIGDLDPPAGAGTGAGAGAASAAPPRLDLSAEGLLAARRAMKNKKRKPRKGGDGSASGKKEERPAPPMTVQDQIKQQIEEHAAAKNASTLASRKDEYLRLFESLRNPIKDTIEDTMVHLVTILKVADSLDLDPQDKEGAWAAKLTGEVFSDEDREEACNAQMVAANLLTCKKTLDTVDRLVNGTTHLVHNKNVSFNDLNRRVGDNMGTITALDLQFQSGSASRPSKFELKFRNALFPEEQINALAASTRRRMWSCVLPSIEALLSRAESSCRIAEKNTAKGRQELVNKEAKRVVMAVANNKMLTKALAIASGANSSLDKRIWCTDDQFVSVMTRNDALGERVQALPEKAKKRNNGKADSQAGGKEEE